MQRRDIINELVSDHWLMRDLLKELRDKNVRTNRKHLLLKRLGLWMKAHARGEEKTINQYGKLHRATQVLAYEDTEEHSTAELIFRKLQHTRSNPQLWAARLHLLCELLEHHLDEEEEEYFPILRENLSAEQSEKMAKRYRALTEDLDEERPRPKPGILGWLSSRPDPSVSDANFI
jgi:hemerythrin-like domain-containing protein